MGWPAGREPEGHGVPIVLVGVTAHQGARESRVQGEAAIRSLEMAEMPRTRGRDCKVFDNLGAVEVEFLPPRCRGDARSPLERLTLKLVKRERKAVMSNPPAHPAEQSGAGVGTRTHYGIVVMCDRPTWVIGLVQNGHGEWLDTSSRDPGASRKYPGEQCGPTRHGKRHPGTA